MFFKSDKCSKASSSIREQCVVTCFFNVFRLNYVCIKEVYVMEVSEIASLCKCCPFKCIKDELIFLLVFEIFFYFFTCIEDELLSLHVYENLRVIFPHIYVYMPKYYCESLLCLKWNLCLVTIQTLTYLLQQTCCFTFNLDSSSDSRIIYFCVINLKLYLSHIFQEHNKTFNIW